MKNNKSARKYNSLVTNKLLDEISDEIKLQITTKMLFAVRLDELMKEKGLTEEEYAKK